VAPRLFVDGSAGPWSEGLAFDLPEGAARHVQVLRLQPGDPVTLFDGSGAEWVAEVTVMGRRSVSVKLMLPVARDVELPVAVTLAVGMPANDRMDALVEKATELGVHAIQPLVCARSVLRLDGDRALKKVAHWQSVAVAASEQSGRTHVPRILPVMPLKAWLTSESSACGDRALLTFEPRMHAQDWIKLLQSRIGGSMSTPTASMASVMFMSGPEGGLTDEEEAQARATGWVGVGLGPRVLRADTAPLMALSLVAGLLESGDTH
jgi:16S rRNA (uracil1498-N3)-methyltransferase